MKPSQERNAEDWLVCFDVRSDRLRRLIALAVPKFVVSREIDLIRDALAELDRLAGDPVTADKVSRDLTPPQGEE